MITLTAKIILANGDSTALQDKTSESQGNNISCDFGAIFNQKRETKNVFILGADKLDGSKTFSNGVNYFIGNHLSNSDGSFSPSYNFTITNSKPNEVDFTYFTIVFDTKNNAHPNNIYIDGFLYNVTSPIFFVSGINGSETHTIKIVDWNKPNSPLIITGFYLGLQILIDRRNILSIESSIFDRSDLKLPSFGIISNTGNVEFNDTDGTIEQYANALMLKSGQVCEISLNNTLVANAAEIVAVMETDQWGYDNDSRVVSVSLKDDLEEWQDINVPEISYDPSNPISQPFSWLYNHLWKITSQNYNMKSLSQLDVETKSVLNNTYIKYPLLEAGNLWEQWTKLCVVCQLHIYKDKNGVIACRYNGGN